MSLRTPEDPILSPFERLASRRSERPLVVSSRFSASIGEVADLSRALAAVLLRAGLESGDILAVAIPNGPAFLAAILATRRTGLAALLLDHTAPPADHQIAVEALGARAVLRCATPWPAGVDEFSLDSIGPVRRTVPGIAVIKLTSGSTGLPRGVAASAENVCADEAALATSMGLAGEERIVAAIPMPHSYGFSSIALPALVRGSLLAIPDDAHHPFAPLDAARAAGATFFPTVPAYLQGLLRLSQPPPWPESVRLVITAGAPLPPETARAFRQTYGQPVHVFYGASECGGIAYDREGGAGERGTVGTPVEGVQIELSPFEGQRPEEGMVTVRSASVASFYLPETDPHLEAGCFQASDRAVWENRELRLLGRVDRLINVKGKKVDPIEVERVLAELPGVDEVSVIGIPAGIPGIETVRAVVACGSRRLSHEAILGWCKERLADHKIPRSVVIVPVLPRNARGKLDRNALLTIEPPAPGATSRG